MSAPDISLPSTPNSSLVNALTSSAPAPPAPVLNESGSPDDASTPSYTPGNRLAAVLGAVSKVASTAFAGIPAGNRPSFAAGLGQGARAEQQAQATDQAIKFRSFDDQMRAANLHNQDLQKQAATDQQNAAQQAAEDFQNEELGKQGGTMQTHPNSGPAVIQTFQGQTAGNGSASIEAGTHISADGKNINVPAPTPQTLAAQITNNNNLAGILPGVTRIATFDPATAKSPSDVVAARAAVGRQLDVTQHLLQGYDVNGNPLTHAQLNDLIPAYQAQIDSLTKNGGASDYQIGTLKNTLAILQANEQNHSAAEDAVAAKATSNAVDKATQLGTVQTGNKIAVQENASALKPKPDTTQLDSVAYDPNYQNPDGTKGGNVVMSKGDAQAQGLQHYKADPATLNTVVAGFNDVQNKLNQLADVVNDPSRMSQVVPGTAAAMLAHGKGIGADFHGIGIDTSRINEKLYAEDVAGANQATRDYVTAMVAAHDAMTNLPRLQTFGKSNRMTQSQLEAAVNLLPQAGDGAMAAQKMTSLQQMIDPLRKQVPHMPGAELTPSWLEKQGGSQKTAAPAQQTAPTSVGKFDPQTQTIQYNPL